MRQRPEQPSPDSRREKDATPAKPETPKPKAGVAETAGQVTADCAAVCCCCTFGLVNLLYLCFIKLPTGLVIQLARQIKRRAHRCRVGSAATSCSCSSKMRKSFLYSFEEQIDACFEKGEEVPDGSIVVFDLEPTKEVMELEKEMWSNFNNSGFGRSLSRRYK